MLHFVASLLLSYFCQDWPEGCLYPQHYIDSHLFPTQVKNQLLELKKKEDTFDMQFIFLQVLPFFKMYIIQMLLKHADAPQRNKTYSQQQTRRKINIFFN